MKRRGMVQRVAMAAAGIAMATSLGVSGAGMASAAAPALHVTFGSNWEFFIACPGGNPFEAVTFESNGTWFSTSPAGDSGIWKGGGTTLTMKWSGDVTEKFKGNWVQKSREYSGMLTGKVTDP